MVSGDRKITDCIGIFRLFLVGIHFFGFKDTEVNIGVGFFKTLDIGSVFWLTDSCLLYGSVCVTVAIVSPLSLLVCNNLRPAAYWPVLGSAP